MGSVKSALTRRHLLAGMAALSAASCCSCSGDHDVVVIGAGAAGIGAAKALAALGRSCLVVEADSRIGGRALTDMTTFPIPFDIGCAWIHAGMTNPFYAMALEQGFLLRKHDVDTLNELFFAGQWQGEQGVKDVEGVSEKIIDEAKAETRAGRDVSLASLMSACGEPQASAATFMGPMDASVDFSNESSTDLTAEEGAEYDPNYLVHEGFGTLVAAVGRGIKVSLSTSARKISDGANGVTIETDKGTLRAKAVIVTASTGVLQSGAIRFDPVLPAVTEQAIHNLPMGLLTKIPMLIPGVDHYTDNVAPYDNVLNEVAPNPAEPCREANGNVYFLAWPWDSDLMVGFVGGSYAWSLARRPPDEVYDLAATSLGQIYGSDIKKKVKKHLVTPWGTNPLSLGAYAAAVPGHYAARDALRRAVRKRIYFAGEAVAEDGLFATCGGAYLSGAAQARAVHAALGSA